MLDPAMPRCGKCHSQWASFFRCPHCEAKSPAPAQLLLVSAALPLAAIALIYVLFSFTRKFEAWRALENNQPVMEKTLTVEIDKSAVQ